MPLTLRPPVPTDEIPVRQLHEQLGREGFSVLSNPAQSWGRILAQLADEAAGRNLAPGRVPQQFLVADVEGVIVGQADIRMQLSPTLLEWGGHVAYCVAPEHRRRKYATAILGRALERLNREGVEDALLTCLDSNRASALTIERCGGVLEDVRLGPDGQARRRYWVSTSC